jgi:hypothetical protein
VLKFLPLILLGGCVTTHNPKPSDTKFDESKRDWLSTYKEEFRIAVENRDLEAQYFFMQEIFKIELKINRNIDVPENPRIKIIN